MNKKYLDPRSQRVARAARGKKLDLHRSKPSGVVVRVGTGHMDVKGHPIKVKVSDVIKALDEVENARTVRDVVSSASKAKSLLKKYRDSQKICG